MYSVIIGIHAIFIGISHLLGYRVFEGVFLLLCLFFLFYFSPLFFFDTEKNDSPNKKIMNLEGILEKFSPKDSLFIPLTLLYLAIYGFVISAFGSAESFLSIHSILSIGIFLILFGYVLSFEWKNDMFSEVFIYHTYISFLSTLLFSFLFYFEYQYISITFLILSIFTIFSGFFYFSFSRNIHFSFSSLFFFATLGGIFSIIKYIFHFNSFFLLLFLIVVFSFIVFEYCSKVAIIASEKRIFRYLSLFSSISTLPFLFYLSFSTISFPFVLLLGMVLYFLSIHVRYSNYITYSLAIIIIYFLYSLLFFSLLETGAILSVLLFIFFLPFLLLSMTYFWQERFEYDFIILHYSAILFSSIFSIYSLFFIGWGSSLLFMISSCIMGLAILFFMSYFRFRK